MPRALSWPRDPPPGLAQQRASRGIVPGLLAAALALALAGCAGVPRAVRSPVPFAADAAFAIDGRLSARRGQDAIAIAFSWAHAPPRDEFVVSSPLGQAIAELTGDASIPRVEVRTADGRRDEATDWGILTERVVGFALPVRGLARWTQGAPRADAPYDVEIDTEGRIGVLRQDGCEIVYAYADDSVLRPTVLRVRCHDLELRIAIDRWRAS